MHPVETCIKIHKATFMSNLKEAVAQVSQRISISMIFDADWQCHALNKGKLALLLPMEVEQLAKVATEV